MSLMLGTNKIASKNVTGDTEPVGTVKQWYSNTIPDNYLLANGQAVSRTIYSDLFTLWGTTFGTGDGSTTFNVIDLRDYVPVGKSTTDTNIDTIGEKYGSKFTEAHSHTIDTGTAESGQTGIYPAYVLNARLAYYAPNRATTFGTGNCGNMQPSCATNFIIKAKQSSGVVATVVNGFDSTSTTNAGSANNDKYLYDNKVSRFVVTGTSASNAMTSLGTASGLNFTYEAVAANLIDTNISTWINTNREVSTGGPNFQVFIAGSTTLYTAIICNYSSTYIILLRRLNSTYYASMMS